MEEIRLRELALLFALCAITALVASAVLPGPFDGVYRTLGVAPW